MQSRAATASFILVAALCAAAPASPDATTRGAAGPRGVRPLATPPEPATADGAGAGAFAPPAPRGPCLAATRNGYLRTRLRGAVDLDVAWESPGMQCEGAARPDGRGLRVTIAGEPRAGGRRLRFVFGIDDVPEGASVRARPTNLTLIFEGEQRLFATRGSDKCTTDELRQERIGALGGPRRSWRVVARGFCVAPATTLAGEARVLVTSFDFASEVTYEDALPDPAP